MAASSKQSKEVRFYQTMLISTASDGVEVSAPAKADFWPALLKRLELLETAKRKATINRRDYYGTVARPISPPIHHLQIGRLRDASEGLERTNLDTGETAALLLAGNQRVSEPTFVVPFSNSGKVAVMGPGLATRASTIGNWLTNVCNLVPQGQAIRLAPIVDVDALQLLMESKGAVGVQFQIDTEKELTTEGDKSLIGAVDGLRRKGPSEGTMYVGWSLGRDRGTLADKSMLKKLAEQVTTHNLAKRAEANLIIEDEDGNIRHETHNLFEDQIVEKARWSVERSRPSDVSAILLAIGKAMSAFEAKVAKKS